MPDRRVRVVVSGRVQGVFYRATLRAEATRRAVAGWARNLPDGRVEAELQGQPHDVDAVVAWCREGPAQARVSDVEVEELPVDHGLHGFSIE